EYEAPCDGTVMEIFCRAGDILPSGGPFLRVETADESLKHLRASDTSEPVRKASGSSTVSSVVQEVEPPAEERPPENASQSVPSRSVGIIWTPRAQKLARENGLNPETIFDIAGTGPGGRVSGDDVVT